MLYTLVQTPHFLRSFKKLPEMLQDEVVEKMELFRDPANHERLRTHRLRGSMKHLTSFSVNYRTRVIVEIKKGECFVYVLDVGDHSVYE